MPTEKMTIYPSRELAAQIRLLAKTEDRSNAKIAEHLIKEALAARAKKEAEE